MATNFSNTLQPACLTDAQIRAWATFIDDTLVNGGWIYVSQAGDTAPGALLAATAGLQKKGFRVYRMNDTLQATKPVFMRIDYGSGGGASPWSPSVWLTIGKGTDGSGNITSVFITNAQSCPINAVQTGTHPSYGSAASNRCTFGLFTDSTLYCLAFGLERSKDSTGNDTGYGLMHVRSSIVTTDSQLRYADFFLYDNPVQPTEEQVLNYILSQQNPSETFPPGDVGVGILIFFAGTAQQPGLNWLICNSLDVSPNGFIDTILYSQAHRYQMCGVMHTAKGLINVATIAATDTNARVLIRYE